MWRRRLTNTIPTAAKSVSSVPNIPYPMLTSGTTVMLFVFCRRTDRGAPDWQLPDPSRA